MAGPALPPTPADIFNEAIAVVPLVHTPLGTNQHVLVIGNAAIPAALVALRFPCFSEVAIVGPQIPPGLVDKRIHTFPSPQSLPTNWRADLIVIAAVSIGDDLLAAVQAHATRNAVVCVAVPAPQVARQTKDLLKHYWPIVQPWRIHLPEPQYFMLASTSPFNRVRPVPGSTRRISDNYIPTLFTWGKDELAMLYGGG